MAKDKQLKENIEQSKLLFTASIFVGIGALIIALFLFFSGVVSSWAGLDSYALGLIPFVMVTLYAIAALFYSKFYTAAAYEEDEKALLKERKDSAFDVGEDVRFTSGRTFQNYEKFAPYVLSVISMLVLTVILILFWRQWQTRVQLTPPTTALHVAFINVVLMFIGAFIGAFCLGQSRAKFFRWLRPVGAWLIAAFVVMLLSAISAVYYNYGKVGVDPVVTKIIFWFFVVLDVEFLSNFITEFYRPRTLEEVRPVYESRILALFTEPGGVMRNVSDTLDYQFGFKVSKTWLYGFLEKALLPLILLWAMILWLFTGIVEVQHDEVGVRVRFGKIVSEQLLDPGVYLKLPYPMETIVRVSPTRIHEVLVGSKPEIKDGKEVVPDVVSWTKKHYAKETDYLVAVKAEKDAGTNADSTISVLGASVPVQFTINREHVFDYLFKNRDSDQIVQKISEQELTKFLASVDMLKVMSSGRQQAIETLRQIIQKEVDRHDLGVNIVAVCIHDIHPPVENVAPAFQDVINAMEEKEAAILGADAYKIAADYQAKTDALGIKLAAEAYSNNMIRVSQAESERFLKQLLAYTAMPSMFRLNSYLDFLENDCRNIRKYIFSKGIPYEIYEINLEEKARLDLLDANLSEIAK